MQQGFPLADEHAHARRTDPLESHLAAETATKSLHATRERVLIILRMHGPVTDEELVARARAAWPDWKISDASIRSRRSDLHKDGLVHRNGRGTTRFGRACSKWDTLA